MEIKKITVFYKGTRELVTQIFEDEDGVKQITSNDFEVFIETKDSHVREPNA